MNTTPRAFLRLIVLLLLVLSLSACALGGRLRNSAAPLQVTASVESSPPADAQAQHLMDLIIKLDAANQSADAMENLP